MVGEQTKTLIWDLDGILMEHHNPKPQVVDTLLTDGKLIPSETTVIGDQFVVAEFARNLGAKAILVSRRTVPIPHMDRLGNDWGKYVQLVRSLDEVRLT